MGESGGNPHTPFLRQGSGLSDRQLRHHERLLRGVYAGPGTQPTAYVMALAAWEYSRGNGILGGRSAAAIHGAKHLDDRRKRARPRAKTAKTEPHRYREHDWDDYEYYDPEPPVLIRPRNAGSRPVPGLLIREADLWEDEVTSVRGIRVTTPARTGFDLARWPATSHPPRRARVGTELDGNVALVDALCNATRADPAGISVLAARHPRSSGLDRLRRVLPLVDGGAASPQETRLRLFLLRKGFPRPQTQVAVLNEYGVLVGHVDVGWPRWKVGIEYDGEWHRRSAEKYSDDKLRYAEFESLGWKVLSIDKTMLRMEAVLEDHVAEMLSRAGAPV